MTLPKTSPLIPSFLLLVVLAVECAVAGVNNFVFDGFARDDLALSHAARITDSRLLRLTDCAKQKIGHAFYPSSFPLKSGGVSFSTTFVFAIVPKHSDTFGHGIAFAVSPTMDIPGCQPSQYLGLFNETNHDMPVNHIVAVEFDTVQNYDVGDIDDNHVGVDVNQLTSHNASAARYLDKVTGESRELRLASGESVQVWIDYDGLRGEISVTISPLTVPKPTTPLLVSEVNLSSILTDEIFVGFSSSTGAATASHYVRGWSFSLDGEAEPLDHGKLPPVPTSERHAESGPSRLIVFWPVTVMVVVLLMISLSAVTTMKKRRKFAEVLDDWEVECGSQRFRYKDLYEATDGFEHRNIVGTGGFGVVYKGVLRASNMEVAVKKISHNSRQGMKEFVAEIASMSRLRHRNLVQLLGYCRSREELLLVYEYMANGSLDRFLFLSDRKALPVLTWPERFHIIKDVAAGLLYLHEGWERVVVHRDIKASNVLLDGRMNGKLSDFGLARLHDHGTDPHTTGVAGTFGYLAPELRETSKATTAADVYAFGTFLLEVACGKRPGASRHSSADERDRTTLVDWVLERWRKGSLADAVDPKIGGAHEPTEVERVLRMGLLCSHPEATARPSIRQVVRMLEGEAAVPPLATPSSSSTVAWGSEGFHELAVTIPVVIDTPTQSLCTYNSVP